MSFIKKLFVAATLFFIILSSAMVFAKITHTVLVFDTRNNAQLPGRFRTTNDLLSTKDLNLTGLRHLHIAGSNQFSELGLQAALNKIPSKAIVVVDLRRESHGFLNGNAVSWYGPQNAANASKTAEEIASNEAKLLEAIKGLDVKSVATIVKKTKDAFIKKIERENISVKKVLTEEQLAASFDVDYQRFYVDDHHAPRNGDVNRFVAFAKDLPSETWLYFHCRGGKGRTSTFMTMYDMMKNAKQLSFNEIVDRQTALGGSHLSELPAVDSYKYGFAHDRLEFLKQFYQYAKNNQDGFATKWSDWKAKRMLVD